MKQIGQRPVQGNAPFPILHRSESGKRDIHGKSQTNFPEDLKIMQWSDSVESADVGDNDSPGLPLESLMQVMGWLRSYTEVSDPSLASMATAAHSSVVGLVHALDSVVHGGAE